MKKQYYKPRVFCEDLQPESMLCGCLDRNAMFNDVTMCGYDLKVPYLSRPVRIFSDGWLDCQMNGEDFGYCYHISEINLFSS